MVTRIRIAIGFALLATLMTSIGAFAKGAFSFVAITGPDLKREIRSSDPALTADFFAFADFYRDRTGAPADPGKGYEVTRYYIDGKHEIAFDRLHYYPESGFVFYDGIENGSSEYDDEWYTADPRAKPVFENVLSSSSLISVTSAQRGEIRRPLLPWQWTGLIIVGLLAFLLFTHRLHRVSAR